MDAVDLARYPALANVEHWTATLAAGDCIYIPEGWYHQVRSVGSRSLAVNVWFAPMYGNIGVISDHL